MQQRRRGMGSDDCFIIFDDREDPDGPAADHLHESEALVGEAVLEGVVWDGGTGSASLDEAIVVDLPAEGWRGGDSQLRFIQFRFNERSFDLDIPNTTLSRAEAETILRRRLGFFHAVERLDLEKIRRTGSLRSGSARCGKCTSTATNLPLRRTWHLFGSPSGSSPSTGHFSSRWRRSGSAGHRFEQGQRMAMNRKGKTNRRARSHERKAYRS